MTSGQKKMADDIFIFIMKEEGKKMTTIDCIPMVCEFADVFPKELTCLPPHREMDFSIDVSRYRSNINSSI